MSVHSEFLLAMALLVAVALPAQAQSIVAEGNVETDGQLVSNVSRGTPPLVVESSTMIANLNADRLDGMDGTLFALASELLAAVTALDNPAPPCFDDVNRMVDCANGTVADAVTGLIWLKKADCFPNLNFGAAAAAAAALASGQCGLTDGSRAGDWRMPTKDEWQQIMNPACPTAPKLVATGTPAPGCYANAPWAIGVSTDPLTIYWSSESVVSDTSVAWVIDVTGGFIGGQPKAGTLIQVWPVRNGR